MMPLPYLDLVWLKSAPLYLAIFTVMCVRCIGAHINWVFVSMARPNGKGLGAMWPLRPLYNLIKSAPIFHGTIFRLLPIPQHFKVIFLGICDISYANFIKTQLIASIFQIPFLAVNSPWMMEIIGNLKKGDPESNPQQHPVNQYVSYAAAIIFIASYVLSFIFDHMPPTKSPFAIHLTIVEQDIKRRQEERKKTMDSQAASAKKKN